MLEHPAPTAKLRTIAERKAKVAALARLATGKAREGIERIDVRATSPRERAFAETLTGKARTALASHAKRAA